MPAWLWIPLVLAALALALSRAGRVSGAYVARALLRPVVRTIYALRTTGAGHVPARGGALLVANHASYADPFLLAACVDRPVRFLMHRSYYERPAIGLFARWVGAIPVASGDTDEARERALAEAARALAAGDLVAIFAEGGITRTGNLLGFRRGLETIARSAGAVIVPVGLDRVWGSIFSYAGGRALRKWPRHLPYRVDVHFAAPLPPATPAHAVRDAVVELLARAGEARARERAGLARQLLLSARRHRSLVAVRGEDGSTWTHAQLFAHGLGLARALGRRGAGERVGILVPPGPERVACHVALALAGRVAVPLDVRAAPSSLADDIARAELADVLVGGSQAAPHGLERVRALELAELLRGHDRGAHLRARALLWLPRALAAALLSRRRGAGPALLLVGERGFGGEQPVPVSDGGLVAVAKSYSQAVELGPGERTLCLWPEERGAGCVCGLWAPLLSGAELLVPGAGSQVLELGRWARAREAGVVLASSATFETWAADLAAEQRPEPRLGLLELERGDSMPERSAGERGPVHAGYARSGVPIAVGLPDVVRGGVKQRNGAPGSVGRPLAGVGVRISNPSTGEPCAPDETGRVLVRGAGFLSASDRGWIDTGDRGALDRDGLLAIVSSAPRPRVGEVQAGSARAENQG